MHSNSTGQSKCGHRYATSQRYGSSQQANSVRAALGRPKNRGPLSLRLVSSLSILGSLVGLAALPSCNKEVPRFPNEKPRWEDADRSHVSEEPDEYYSGMLADVADKNFLRPLARLPYLPLSERAHNVNALDEVPNSSWFQNRIGFYPMTPDEMARGACGDTPTLNTDEPWEITAAKPNGAYPGFFIKSGDQRYLLKFDSPVQPGRATSADVIGSKIYHAAGYHAPCNEIVYFTPGDLKIAEGATAEDKYGKKTPITEADIHKVLEKSFRTKDGRLRASASRFLPGKPLGPFRYEGRRGDDPNDHVRHEHRRELRGNRLLSAWLHHHDAREQNTLDVWMQGQGPKKNKNFIRHYMIDFGDCLGSRWAFDPVSKRFGYAYFVDFGQVASDLLTLGAYPRPWHGLEINPEAEIFGYFNVKDFYPQKWKAEYPNPAFSEMRHDDALWMARILSRFTSEQLEAVIKTARLENDALEKLLLDTLMGRRDKILQAYFTQYAPLDRFKLVKREAGRERQSLCFDDLAIQAGVVNPKHVLYKARFYKGPRLEDEIAWMQFQPHADEPGRSCLVGILEGVKGAPIDAPGLKADAPERYGVIKLWIHQQADILPTSAVHLHFYHTGKKGYRLVGIERPDRPSVPDLY